MNANPHTHDLKITLVNDDKALRVIYGDTATEIWLRWHPFRKRGYRGGMDALLDKKIQMVIGWHDSASQRAGARMPDIKGVGGKYRDVLAPMPDGIYGLHRRERTDKFGSQVIKEELHV